MGKIHGKEIILLINSGASKAFSLKQTETKPFLVEVGNNQKVKCRGRCKEVELCIDKLWIKKDYLLFNLGSADVVLGLEWLETWVIFKLISEP